MKVGDFIKIVLSSNQVEEGIIISVDDIEKIEIAPQKFIYRHWLVLAHKDFPNLKLTVDKKEIIAFQISEIELQKAKEVFVVDDQTINQENDLVSIDINDKNSRIKRLAHLAIKNGEKERNYFKKNIKNNNGIPPNISLSPKYKLPFFIKK